MSEDWKERSNRELIERTASDADVPVTIEQGMVTLSTSDLADMLNAARARGIDDALIDS